MYRVLIVEDEELLRKGLCYAFDWAARDCAVVADVDNGVSGVEQIRELRPDIVVTDLTMPLMGGLQMLEETVGEIPYAAIIVSGYDEFELARTAIRLGVTEYLLKPVEFEELAAALDRAKTTLERERLFRTARDRREEADDVSLLARLEPDAVTSRHVEAMLQYVRDHYAEKIGIADLTGELGVSASWLTQRFKAETSYTFNDYLTRYRILQAIALIRSGQDRIYHIAEQVGFRDYKYFISVFKKYVGVSPRRFAERHGT